MFEVPPQQAEQLVGDWLEAYATASAEQASTLHFPTVVEYSRSNCSSACLFRYPEVPSMRRRLRAAVPSKVSRSYNHAHYASRSRHTTWPYEITAPLGAGGMGESTAPATHGWSAP